MRDVFHATERPVTDFDRTVTEASFRAWKSCEPAVGIAAEPDDEAIAEYLLDLLSSARQLTSRHKLGFLNYLIGMAEDEARLLATGGPSGSR